MSDYIKLLTSTSITINRIAELLEQNNIPCYIKNNAESALAAGFGSPQNDVDLYVFESDFEKAREFVEEV